MNILITGGAGFIGSQLAKSLILDNCNVTLLDNLSHGYKDNFIENGKPICNFIEADIRDDNFEKYLEGIDIVFHLAAISSLPYCQVNPLNAFDNNVRGVINILEAIRKTKSVKRFIFSSTSAVYENNKNKLFDESLNVNPDLIYSVTKYNAESICRSYAKNYGIDTIICRFFNVYGEHADIHRVMPPFISYIAKEFYFNRSPILFNQTNAKRDYIYINDLIEILLLMIKSKEKYVGEIFNLCSGEGYSVPELLELYSNVSNKNIRPLFKDPIEYWDKFPELFINKALSKERIKKEVYKNSIGSIAKTKQHFNFQSKTEIIDGLKRIHKYSERVLANK